MLSNRRKLYVSRLELTGNIGTWHLLYTITRFIVVCQYAGVIGVAVTGILLDASSDQDISSGWWQAFAACAVQCMAGSAIFVIAAKGNRLFGSDTDS